MKRIASVALLCVLLPGLAGSQTLFAERGKYKSIRAYLNYVESQRMRLYSGDENVREDRMEVFIASLRQVPQEGDAIFPLVALGEFVMGKNIPGKDSQDRELQEEAIAALAREALDEEGSMARREAAAIQLVRIASGGRYVTEDLMDDTLEALVEPSSDPNRVPAKIAMTGLGKVAIRTGSRWEAAGLESAVTGTLIVPPGAIATGAAKPAVEEQPARWGLREACEGSIATRTGVPEDDACLLERGAFTEPILEDVPFPGEPPGEARYQAPGTTIRVHLDDPVFEDMR